MGTQRLDAHFSCNASTFHSPTKRFAFRVIVLLAAIIAAVAIGFAAQAVWRLPDLAPWDTLRLGNELKAGPRAPQTFAEYLALEERLFAELRERIYASPTQRDTNEVDRYYDAVPASAVFTRDRVVALCGADRRHLTALRAARAGESGIARRHPRV